MKVIPEAPGPGQESVWAYPRPAIAEPNHRHLKIIHRNAVVAETRGGVRTLETTPPAIISHRTRSRRPYCARRASDPCVSGRDRRFTSTSSFRAKFSATWPGVIPIRRRPSCHCAIMWPSTPGLSTDALSMVNASPRSPEISTAAGFPVTWRAPSRASRAAASGRDQLVHQKTPAVSRSTARLVASPN